MKTKIQFQDPKNEKFNPNPRGPIRDLIAACLKHPGQWAIVPKGVRRTNIAVYGLGLRFFGWKLTTTTQNAVVYVRALKIAGAK